MSEEKQAYEGFAVLELMGHRRIAGYVHQVEQYGTVMLRIDIPGPDAPCTHCYCGKEEATTEAGPVTCQACEGKGFKRTVATTQFYCGSSIYCLTPTTEDAARAVALRNQPQPVQRWEMLPPARAEAHVGEDDDHYEDEYP